MSGERLPVSDEDCDRVVTFVRRRFPKMDPADVLCGALMRALPHGAVVSWIDPGLRWDGAEVAEEDDDV